MSDVEEARLRREILRLNRENRTLEREVVDLKKEHAEDQSVIAVWRGRTNRAEAKIESLKETLQEGWDEIQNWHANQKIDYNTYSDLCNMFSVQDGIEDKDSALEEWIGKMMGFLLHCKSAHYMRFNVKDLERIDALILELGEKPA